MAKPIFRVLFFFAICTASFAMDIKGVRFPDQIKVRGKTLHLNGVALLQKTIFRVDVYVAGLYLQTPANEPEKILSSPGIKDVTLVFLRDISGRQLSDAWKEGYENACGHYCDKTRSQLTRFISMLRDVHRGQEVRLVFLRDRLSVASTGQTHVIKGSDFSRIFLSTFIGDRTSAKEISDGLLARTRA